ncbi:MAG: hypothetical protein ACPL4H_08290 [Anaerolineales bacterium]
MGFRYAAHNERSQLLNSRRTAVLIPLPALATFRQAQCIAQPAQIGGFDTLLLNPRENGIGSLSNH